MNEVVLAAVYLVLKDPKAVLNGSPVSPLEFDVPSEPESIPTDLFVPSYVTFANSDSTAKSPYRRCCSA